MHGGGGGGDGVAAEGGPDRAGSLGRPRDQCSPWRVSPRSDLSPMGARRSQGAQAWRKHATNRGHGTANVFHD